MKDEKDFTNVSSDLQTRKVRAYSLLHGSKDAAMAMRLTTLFTDSSSLFCEIGCSNGENSINNLMYCKAIKGVFPGMYLGTDIHPMSVALSKMTFRTLRFPFSCELFVANATTPLGISHLLDYNKVVVLALRVIPIFDPLNAEIFLKEVNDEWRGRNLSLVVSYALPSGSHYQRNLLKLKDKTIDVEQTCFSGGSCFFQRHPKVGKIVLQTYYEREAFRELAKRSGFSVVEFTPANDFDSLSLVGNDDPFTHREVALLTPLK